MVFSLGEVCSEGSWGNHRMLWQKVCGTPSKPPRMVTEDRDLCILRIVGEKMLFLPPEFEVIYFHKAPRLQGKIRGKLKTPLFFWRQKKLVFFNSALKDKVARPTFGWIKPVPWDQCSWKFGCVFQPREIRYHPWSWSWYVYLYMIRMICMVNW